MSIMAKDHSPESLWAKIIDDAVPGSILCRAMKNVAQSISQMAAQPVDLDCATIDTVSLKALDALGDELGVETVGVYLLLMDEPLTGEAILIFSPDNALKLVDWLLEESPGTTTQLDSLASSALSELGNQALSTFLNTVADVAALPLRPSPPTVVVDTLDVIFEAVALAAAGVTDELLLIKTRFDHKESSLSFELWLVPDLVIEISAASTTANAWKWQQLGVEV